MSPHELREKGGKMKNKTRAASQGYEVVRWSGGGRRSQQGESARRVVTSVELEAVARDQKRRGRKGHL